MNKGGLVIVDNVKSHRFKSMFEFIDGIHKDPIRSWKLMLERGYCLQ